MKKVFVIILLFTVMLLPGAVKFDWGYFTAIGQFQYAVKPPHSVNTFDLKRLRVLTGSEILPGRISLDMQLEFRTAGISISESEITDIGPSGIKKINEINLLDLKATFKLPFITITAGRFILPVDHYSPSSTAKLDLIEYPLAETFAPWRQIGVLANAKIALFNVFASITNGGANTFEDTDTEKAYMLRLDISPVKGAAVGFSGYSENSAAEDISTYLGSGRANVYAWYRNDLFFFISQLSYSEKDSYSTEITTEYSYSYFLHLSAFIGPFEGILRYEFMDKNANIKGELSSRLTFGLNFKMAERAVLMANYLVNGESADTDNDVFAVQLQLVL